MHYEAHELSLAFPDMPADQYRRFVADIRANGLNNPIVLFDGKILDGRHRYRACTELGVKLMTREFNEGDPNESSRGDPVAFVQSENAARRQLSESQLAYAITHPNIVEFERARARGRQGAAGEAFGYGKQLSADRRTAIPDPGRVSEKLAEKAGVGAKTIDRALRVRKEGIPEVNKAVANGEVTLNMAEKIVKLKPASQKRVIEAPAAQRGDALRTAMNLSDAAIRRERRKDSSNPALPAEQATAFVRKFLSGIERLSLVCAEDGARDGGAIATKFMDEMDWDSTPLTLQLERAEPVIRALAIIQQRRTARAA